MLLSLWIATGCSSESYLQKHPYQLSAQTPIDTNGYYIEVISQGEKGVKEEKSRVSFIRFYSDGTAVTGSASNREFVDALARSLIISKQPKHQARFTIVDSLLLYEGYNGYIQRYEYDVYQILSRDSIVFIGTAKKFNARIVPSSKRAYAFIPFNRN